MNEFNPYLIIAPAVMAFLSMALLVAWRFEPQQRTRLWMALGVLAISAALTVQSLLPPAWIAHYAIYTALLYLSGGWLFSLSIARKFGGSAHPRIALCLALLTFALIYYYSRVHENLEIRAYALSLGMGLLHLLPALGVLRNKPHTDWLDTCLYWTYLAFCVYIAARPLTLLVFEQLSANNLTQSIYWFITLLGGILFYIAFAFLLLGSSINTTLKTLYAERNLDPLTQLLNRRAFEETMAMHAQSNSHWAPMSIVTADIDHFKHINDTFGHDAGDRVLQTVAQCLQTSTRSRDLVARFGGEEFVLLLPFTTAAAAQQLAQRIQKQLTQLSAQQMAPHKLSLSFGIAAVQPNESMAQALKRADVELYKAKQAGRDRIFVAETPI